MTKTKFILVICFIVTFGAGVVTGVALKRPEPPPQKPRPWIEEELNLTAEQREKMHDIWAEVMGKASELRRDQRQTLQKERDAAIQSLLSVQQKTEYDEILNIYARESASLDNAVKMAFEEATQKTKEILSKEQLVKYEKMLKERAGHRRRGSRGGEGNGPDTPPGPANIEPGPPPPPDSFSSGKETENGVP